MNLSHRIYEGTQPYLFVSYAHADNDRVLPLIRGMMDRGLRVWFDAGIEPGGSWSDYIAEHLVGSHAVVIMLSSNSLASNNCRKEILMAGNYRKNVVVVCLEPLKLSPGDEMQLIDYQALYRWKYSSEDTFLSALCRGSVMEACTADSSLLAVGETVSETVVPISPVYETIEEPGSAPIPPAKKEILPSAEETYREARGFYDKQKYAQAFQPACVAAEQGHPGAQYLLGCLYCHHAAHADPRLDTAQAKEAGRRWIRRAAENGDPQAQRYIGETEKDPTLAAMWFRKSADQGDPLGLYQLGECYRLGKGVEKDIVKAMDCYLQAHKRHPASAMKYREVLKKASLSERMALKKAGHSLKRLEN